MKNCKTHKMNYTHFYEFVDYAAIHLKMKPQLSEQEPVAKSKMNKSRNSHI